MAKYKAVIFDYNDTLVESREIKWQHYKHVAEKFYKFDLKKETLLEHWGKPLNTLVGELFKDRDILENVTTAVVSVRGDFLKKAYPGSAEIVTLLLDQGLQVGVLSAVNKRFLFDDLIRLNFPIDHMVIVQGADDTKFHKPDPEVFLPLFEKLKKQGIEKKDIVYVGDSLIDLQAAYKAGIGFIAVTTGLYSYEDFKRNGAKIIMKDIREVVNYV